MRLQPFNLQSRGRMGKADMAQSADKRSDKRRHSHEEAHQIHARGSRIGDEQVHRHEQQPVRDDN